MTALLWIALVITWAAIGIDFLADDHHTLTGVLYAAATLTWVAHAFNTHV